MFSCIPLRNFKVMLRTYIYHTKLVCWASSQRVWWTKEGFSTCHCGRHWTCTAWEELTSCYSVGLGDNCSHYTSKHGFVVGHVFTCVYRQAGNYVTPSSQAICEGTCFSEVLETSTTSICLKESHRVRVGSFTNSRNLSATVSGRHQWCQLAFCICGD